MARLEVTFKFPAALGGGDVTLRDLTVEEEIQCYNLFEGQRRYYEMVKRCIVQVRGVKCDGENRDEVFGSLSPKERDLVFLGYRSIHVAEETEKAPFLASARTKATV